MKARIWKINLNAGWRTWNLVWSTYLLPTYCHMKETWQNLTWKFRPYWPLWPLFDILGIFFQQLTCHSIRVLGGSTTESQLSSCYWHLQFAILGSKIRSFTSKGSSLCLAYRNVQRCAKTKTPLTFKVPVMPTWLKLVMLSKHCSIVPTKS